MPAFLASLDDYMFGVFYFQTYRRHHSPAAFPSVARVNIHVPAIKAFRAMVGIAIAFDKKTAVLAGKIFNRSGESAGFFGHMEFA